MSRGGCGGTSIAHASKVSLMWRMIGWVTWLLDVSSFEFWLLGVSKPEKVVESPYSVRKVVSAIMRWTILLPSLVLSLSTWRARLGTCRLHWENNWSCRISLVAHWYSSWVCTLLQHRVVGSSSLWLDDIHSSLFGDWSDTFFQDTLHQRWLLEMIMNYR